MDLAPSSAVAALVVSTRWVQRHSYFVSLEQRHLSNESPPFYRGTKGLLVVELGLQGPGKAVGQIV